MLEYYCSHGSKCRQTCARVVQTRHEAIKHTYATGTCARCVPAAAAHLLFAAAALPFRLEFSGDSQDLWASTVEASTQDDSSSGGPSCSVLRFCANSGSLLQVRAVFLRSFLLNFSRHPQLMSAVNFMCAHIAF